MKLLKELLSEEVTKKKKDKRKDKTADKFFSFVAGNMLFKNICSGKLSGDTDKK